MLDKNVQLAVETFEYVHRLVMRDIRKSLKAQKLAKSAPIDVSNVVGLRNKIKALLRKSESNDGSDDSQIKRGWTGKVPGFTVDLSETLERVLGRYLKVLQYMMVGDYAGPEALEAVKRLGLEGKIQPGLVYGSYLQAVDAQRAYYKTLFGKNPPDLKAGNMEQAFAQIQGQADRSVRITLDSYRNRILDTVEMGLKQNRLDIMNEIHQDAHEAVDEGATKSEAVDEAASEAVEPMKLKELKGPIEQVFEKAAEDFERTAETTIGMGSSVGTHQAMMEIFGSQDSDMHACLVSVRDDRCCDSCEHFSRNSDGSLKIHKLTSFKPAGYNFGRKKGEWVMSLPLLHHRCRCSIIYVPPGFTVDPDGSLRPGKRQ